MLKIERMLVALALNDLDEAALRHASAVAAAAGTQRVHFVHADERVEVPAEVRSRFPQIRTPEDVAEQQMRDAVARHFTAPAGADLRFEVGDERQLRSILHALRKHDIDLAVMGRNPDQHWPGTLCERVARKSPCSVLIAPRGTQPGFSRVLVPVDFSAASEQALATAVDLAAPSAGKVIALHVYHVPSGFHRSGKTYEEFADILRGYAERDCQALAARYPATVETRCVLHEKPAEAIRIAVEDQHFDLLVMGARGRTDSAAVLLGSVTERVLNTVRVPVLAVKQKGANMGILDALLSL